MTDVDVHDRKVEGFEARLLPMLLEAVSEGTAAPHQWRRRRSPRRKLARAGALALAAVVAAVVAANTLAVGADTVQVRAADAVRDPAAVEQQLRAQGIDATIVVVPVPADVDGTWWALSFAPRAQVSPEDWSRLLAQVGEGVDPGLPPQTYDDIIDAGRNVYHHQVLEIPKGVHGPMTLFAGRTPRAGESLAGLGGQLSPVGTFYCLGLARMEPSAAAAALSGLGYGVQLYYDPQPFAPVGVDPGDGYVGSPPAGSEVADVWFATPTDVVVELVPADQADAVRAQTGTPTPGSTPPAWAPSCP